jgi:hypothetical protein
MCQKIDIPPGQCYKTCHSAAHRGICYPIGGLALPLKFTKLGKPVENVSDI